MTQEILQLIKAAIENDTLEMSLHAVEEAHEEQITPAEIAAALSFGQIIENYPEHRRGACCLIYGDTPAGRPLHIVCTSMRVPPLVITVYEPRLPKWRTPTQRRNRL